MAEYVLSGILTYMRDRKLCTYNMASTVSFFRSGNASVDLTSIHCSMTPLSRNVASTVALSCFKLYQGLDEKTGFAIRYSVYSSSQAFFFLWSSLFQRNSRLESDEALELFEDLDDALELEKVDEDEERDVLLSATRDSTTPDPSSSDE